MNPQPSLPPSDGELDTLLSAQVRHTSPEFERRWRELRATFTRPRPTWRRWVPGWLVWPGLATAAAAVLVLALTLRHRPAAAGYPDSAFEELITLDAALAPAQPLLEPQMRDAVLHLPVARSTP